jgi:hypothetical protein
MKISIMLETPPPEAGKCRYPVRDSEKSVEQEVREALELIDSGHESAVEWKMINRLARELRKQKTPRAKRLLDMIDPVLMKYGIMGDHAGNDEG